MCGFSAQTCEALRKAGMKETDLVHVDVLSDEEIRQGIKEYSSWPTIPQVFIRGEFIGGCDIVCEMLAKGELQKLLSA